jgi:CRP-like cAMP-binding protein
MDITHFLRLQPGFENFSSADLDVFSRMLNVAIYPARHTFTVRGEQGHALYLIMDGAVTMSNSDALSTDNSNRSLRVGEWFGLLSLVENLPAFEDCSTSESVTVASFNRVQFDELFEFAPPIGRHLLYMLAKQLARTLIAQNERLSAQARLAK